NAGTPVVFVALADAQAVGFNAQHVITSVLVTGTAQKVPADLAVLDNAAVKDDLLRPLDRAVRSLDVSEWLLWAIAATIVASAVYLSATERRRDFAVLKATGSSSAAVVGGVALQAELISVGAALLAIAVAFALSPLFPLAVGAPAGALVGLPVIAVVVGGLACLVGVRRVLTADPMLAMTSPA
ncbi:MAG TPA: ABC transporter permease, partial [Candidatus Dormibacteraeota bacterium]|nr:ABC transporter permease [Candidatus Dormibacteraeota bacterium]